MKKVILFNMVSLDGYFEGTGREINWHNVDDEFNEFAVEQLTGASALIFGRVTYELMASYWPSASALKNDPVVAGLMNSIPKYVFSKSLPKAGWNKTEVIQNVSKQQIISLKQQNEKDLFIFGSANLASSFFKLDLIDEFRIMINPVVLGQGNPLFKSIAYPLKPKLLRIRNFRSGNVLLYYGISRENNNIKSPPPLAM